ncbi:MAG: hypothetical protein QOE63_1415 [Acidimicrobiaceae bacterium]
MNDDRQAIRDLADAYAVGVDTRDPELFGSLWAEGAHLVGYRNGRDQPPTMDLEMPRGTKVVMKAIAPYATTLHMITTHRVLITGDAAAGSTYCEAHHVEGTHDLVMAIRYEDAFARAADGWRFARREVHILWTTEHAVTVGGA